MKLLLPLLLLFFTSLCCIWMERDRNRLHHCTLCLPHRRVKVACMCAWTVSWALVVSMWTDTMLGVARGLTCTSPGLARLRWIVYSTFWLMFSDMDTYLEYIWHSLSMSSELIPTPSDTVCLCHRRKKIITLDLDTHLRKSPPDWL